MKKILLILSLFICLSCCKNDPVDKWHTARIDKLYRIVQPAGIMYPFPAYVLRMSDGNDVYLIRQRYNQDLYEGDEIRYQLSSYCRSEISAINGVSLGEGGNYGDDGYAEIPPGGLIASDPIEDVVADIFYLEAIYSVPFLPIKTTCIEVASDGKLLLVKNAKLNVDLAIGDRFVYNVYTLFPNDVLAIKKLR